MSIHQADINNLIDIARIHKNRFPKQLVGSLSCELIAGFYACQLSCSILLVHVSADGVDGFVQGGHPTKMAAGRREFLKQNKWRCLWTVISRPMLLWSTIKSFLKNRGVNKLPKKAPVDCCLRCLAVAPEAVGKGIGTALIEAFESVIRPDHMHYWLSVHDNNVPAIRLYEKMGFRPCRWENHSIVFEKRFDADDSGNQPQKVPDSQVDNRAAIKTLELLAKHDKQVR